MALNLVGGSSQRAVATFGAATAYPCSFWLQCMHNSVANNASSLSYSYSSASERRIEVEMRGDIAGDPVRARIGNQTGTVTAVASSNSYVADVWQRVGIRCNSTSDCSVFLNGIKTTAGSQAAFPASTPNQLNIGSGASGGSYADFITGGAAMVAVWPGVGLTDDEFESLNKGYSPAKVRPQSLEFYGSLTRNMIDIINGAGITLINSPTVKDHPRSYGF